LEKGEFMRTTLNIEDELLDKAARLTGIKEKTSLVRLGLEALIAMESGKRLAKLGGTEKKLEMIPRRRAAGA
jgi:Arc/MetJ family transcription regulator